MREFILNFNYLDGLIVSAVLVILMVLIAHADRVRREKDDYID